MKTGKPALKTSALEQTENRDKMNRENHSKSETANDIIWLKLQIHKLESVSLYVFFSFIAWPQHW